MCGLWLSLTIKGVSGRDRLFHGTSLLGATVHIHRPTAHRSFPLALPSLVYRLVHYQHRYYHLSLHHQYYHHHLSFHHVPVCVHLVENSFIFVKLCMNDDTHVFVAGNTFTTQGQGGPLYCGKLLATAVRELMSSKVLFKRPIQVDR